MRYYAFQYFQFEHTIQGEPNSLTGKHSIAGQIAVFNSKKERDEWVKKGYEITKGYGCNCRKALTYTELRQHCLGMSMKEFKEYINHIYSLVENYKIKKTLTS